MNINRYLLGASKKTRRRRLLRWFLNNLLSILFLTGGCLLLILGAWTSGLWLKIPFAANTFEFVGQPIEGKAPPPGDLQSRTHCAATAITGSTLSLTCGDKRTAVSLDAIVTLPLDSDLGKAAKDLIAAMTRDALVTCEKAADAYTCKIDGPDKVEGPDLRILLLEAGLAAVPDGATKSLVEAQNRAKFARRGLWWDWTRMGTGGKLDPILWRMGRDRTLPNADSTQAQRVQAFSSFVTSAVLAVLGFVGGFWLKGYKPRRIHAQHQERAETMIEDIKESYREFLDDLQEEGLGFVTYELHWTKLEDQQAKLSAFIADKFDKIEFADDDKAWKELHYYHLKDLYDRIKSRFDTFREALTKGEVDEGKLRQLKKSVRDQIENKNLWKR
jgi:hypothetical protein